MDKIKSPLSIPSTEVPSFVRTELEVIKLTKEQENNFIVMGEPDWIEE